MSTNFSLPHGPLNFFASPKDFTGDYNLGPFTTETTQRYVYGTRYITWDGRVFKYGNAHAECQSGYGAANYQVCNISAVLAANAAAGDRRVKLTVTSGGHASDGEIAKDELAGGYIILNNGTEDPYNMLILGNDADVAVTTCMVDLEWPLPAALTTAAYAEVVMNPYAHLSGGLTAGSARVSFMGIPKVNLAAGYKGWIQSWGPCWCTPPSAGATAPGYTDNDRTVYFNTANGSVFGAASGTVVESGFQKAGFVIEMSGSAACGPPLIMLQISV